MSENRKGVVIKNKDLFVKIFKIITWFDEKRWCEENQEKERKRICESFAADLNSSETILTHWLCYITDRGMRFMRVWKNGGAVFSELVKEYRKSNGNVDDILCEFYSKEKKRFIAKNQKDENGNLITYASRFITVDYEHIKQTLEILDKYERNLVGFILHFLENFEKKVGKIEKEKDKEECLKWIASALYLLTYRLKKDKDDDVFKNFLKLLEDEKEFENFKKYSTENKKRLWASLRDYKKGFFSEIFKDAIKEVAKEKADYFIKLWEELPMDALELPGDRWNDDARFKERVLKKAIDFPESWNISKIIREAYEKLKKDGDYRNELEKINFYPERFDVTFDFVRKMCEEKLCDICPFGENGAKFICIPNGKYCTVALITCGYLASCDGEDCILRKENLGRGICNGKIKEK